MYVSFFSGHFKLKTGLVLMALSILTGSAFAQAQPPQFSPKAPLPTYTSVLDSYVRYEPIALIPWPKANQTVQAIGGWRAYARQAHEAAPSPLAPKPGSTP